MKLTLECSRCGAATEPTADIWRCPVCRGPLRWEGPAAYSRDQIADRTPSLWRYASVLPVDLGRAVSLGESITPLVEGRIDGATLRFKLDYLLPTGSFKDRGAAILISHLRALGARRAVEDSSGNAAASIAAYAARAGIACTVFAPAAASVGKLVQATAYGARVERVAGSRDDVATAAIVAASGDPESAYASHNWHPYFIAGVKTWALEVWEQLGLRAPDNVVVPVGAGSMLLGAAQAFSHLRAGKEIEGGPRLFAAQAAACAPLVSAFAAGASEVAHVERQPTIAEGVVIAHPIRGRELLTALRESDGGAVAVTEGEIAAALRDLARQGLYVEPTAAVAAAGARRLLADRVIDPDQTTVVILSGSGLKATETIAGLYAK